MLFMLLSSFHLRKIIATFTGGGVRSLDFCRFFFFFAPPQQRVVKGECSGSKEGGNLEAQLEVPQERRKG